MMTTILYYLFVILALTFIILVHEIGHFIVARKTGMKVERFGIGMGPTIYKKTINDIEYCICAIPIGGFCQIKGEEEASTDTDSYDAKPPIKKFAVAVAGSLSNIILAFLILLFTFSLIGDPFRMEINKIEPSSPAALAELKKGDEIIGVNDIRSYDWGIIRQEIVKNPEKRITLTVLRNGNEFNLAITPMNVDGSGIIGITPKSSSRKINFFVSAKMAFNKVVGFFKDFIMFIGMLLTGKLSGLAVAGPVGIIKMAKESFSVGIGYFLFFMALLSLNLGLVNLFPVPPLDGGKIIFAAIEGIFKRKVNKKVEIVISTVGFALLISLILFVTWNDVSRLIFSK